MIDDCSLKGDTQSTTSNLNQKSSISNFSRHSMSTRQDLISHALRKRYIEVCTNARTLNATAFGDMSDFVDRVREQLIENVERGSFEQWEPPTAWLLCDLDCLSALRALAAGDALECTLGPPADSGFLPQLQQACRDPALRFELLIARYRHPLNFVATTERTIQEHILERLMVSDRSRIERQSPDAIDADDLLLKLNFLGIHASFTTDLRFLDALNYYYELLPSNWYPKSRHNWLLASYWSFYARALTVQVNRIN